ncbi:unnamed protein product [Didymodactylos carnosus]|uniref:Fe2OG dioxygenase domain-containing protein n=1 Tax=Didymodactylos carnosus TaxID=1234261 RepID=A0A814RG23_9BILA|nr:unnamed protein product [Didymodactylos carnosus]CAF1133475.1 unnamed protein product [Didymodactylos carnosus]CAF3842395.1 unnamed protein product [Didymodactylos carnosus]CAF3897338.1 unnamed protein product [Didymodactylos carnosus]
MSEIAAKDIEKIVSTSQKRSLETDEADFKCKMLKHSDNHLLLGSGDSWYERNFFTSNEAQSILDELNEQVEFLPRDTFKFKIFGQINLLPRDKAFYGDVHEKDGSYPLYRYEASKDAEYPQVKQWTPVLQRLRNILLEKTGQRCNHLVVNQYRNNNDHIGYHVDKTRDFVQNASVLTLSFGEKRLFRLKNIRTKEIQELRLDSGSLFVLGPKTNSEWKHSIIKSGKLCGRRVSLTYRTIKTIKHKDGTLTETDSKGHLTDGTSEDGKVKEE